MLERAHVRRHPVPSMEAPTYTRTRPPSSLWAPLVLLCALLVWSFATGRTPRVDAASATGVDAVGTVTASVFVDASACPSTAVDIGDLIAGADSWKTAKDHTGVSCGIDFGASNYAAGASLSMLEDPAAAPSPADALKCASGCASTDSIADFTGGSEPAAGTSAFGTQLLAATGVASADWSLEPAVHGVDDAASQACSTAAMGTGRCTFTWGATAAAATPPGTYEAQASFVVLAN